MPKQLRVSYLGIIYFNTKTLQNGCNMKTTVVFYYFKLFFPPQLKKAADELVSQAFFFILSQMWNVLQLKFGLNPTVPCERLWIFGILFIWAKKLELKILMAESDQGTVWCWTSNEMPVSLRNSYLWALRIRNCPCLPWSGHKAAVAVTSLQWLINMAVPCVTSLTLGAT